MKAAVRIARHGVVRLERRLPSLNCRYEHVFRLITIALISGVSIASKGKLHIPDEKIGELKRACLRSAGESHVNVDHNKGCECVVAKIVGYVSDERTLSAAVKDIEWATGYYSGKISRKDFKRDPLMLNEQLVDFGDECAQGPSKG